MFTPEELAAMRAADEEIDRTFEMTEDDPKVDKIRAVWPEYGGET